MDLAELTQAERAAIVDLYEDRWHELQEDVRTLGWKSREDQALRFRVLADVGDLHGATVCDVGCGFGDLLVHLDGVVSPVDYIGVDLVPSFLEQAARRHPEASFRCLDATSDAFDVEADWFLLSGALSYRVADNMGVTAATLERLLRLARKGVAANFLSSYCTYQHTRNFHYEPEELFRVARLLTPWVRLRHDYPLWEFTLYLYKEGRSA